MDKYGEYAVALVAILVSGGLVAQDSLDAGVFSSVTTLCLGYVFGKQVTSTRAGNS